MNHGTDAYKSENVEVVQAINSLLIKLEEEVGISFDLHLNIFY